MVDNKWQYNTIHNSACKVIEEQTLWGQTVCRVWLPNQDAVVRVPRPASDLWLNCTMYPVPLQGIYVPEMSNNKIRLHYQYICGFGPIQDAMGNFAEKR